MASKILMVESFLISVGISALCMLKLHWHFIACGLMIFPVMGVIFAILTMSKILSAIFTFITSMLLSAVITNFLYNLLIPYVKIPEIVWFLPLSVWIQIVIAIIIGIALFAWFFDIIVLEYGM